MPRQALPTRLSGLGTEPEDRELRWLWRARRAGVAVAPVVVAPPEVEIDHYRLNNLPERLEALFRGVDRVDPDEDDLEELGPQAEALVLDHALQGEVIDAFYAALEGLPTRLLIRRAGSGGRETTYGRSALLALKRIWADDWRQGELRARLVAGGGLAPEARAVLLHDADVREGVVPIEAVEAAGAVRRSWSDARMRLLRVRLDAP